jgi:hypothetical protein
VAPAIRKVVGFRGIAYRGLSATVSQPEIKVMIERFPTIREARLRSFWEVYWRVIGEDSSL